MDYTSEEDSNVSETEIDEYKEKSYEKLKSGEHRVKVSDQSFTCPYCPMKRKRDYLYKDLLQHASGLGKSSSEKRSAKEKANHLALVKYLENDLGGGSGGGPSKPEGVDEQYLPVNCYHDEKFVWPWTGIVVNIPTRQEKNGQFVGKISKSELKNELIRRGFNPVQVEEVWNHSRGHLGIALVKFNKDYLLGYHDAMSFERAYEADRHAKKDWYAEITDPKPGLYAWIAREDDYNLDNRVGRRLQEIGNLKTVSEIKEDEHRIQDRLISNVTSIIDKKNEQLKEMELKYSASTISLNNLMEEKDKLHRAYNEDLEFQKNELELRGKQLEKCEAENEFERKKLSEEIEKYKKKESSLQLAALEQQKADENVLKLLKDHQREKGDLNKIIIGFEKKLEAKQALELEVEQLKGKVNVTKHMGGTNDNIEDRLAEKQQELEDLEDYCQALITKERSSTDEQQEARKVLINVSSLYP
ncbi:Zinc finger-XS domain containing protein [Trema orientale]|uniref:Zinc finger-XS domain containing protein n=1 Tax=Trema orientale TaxID=63057 RepID=A0A2P5CIW4_TREOI|nr:Zinc finger-XS domain containing protein [Trema orientale]